LFISIHANSSLSKTGKASGYEVWMLPTTYSRKLLDAKTTGTDPEILPIVNSMFEEEISVESAVLAQQILAGLDASIGTLSVDRGIRQNDWYVVRNARMPAVLTEVGFVSNQEEAARLADDAYLNRVAQGLYSGISAFIARFERNEIADAR
jgi:N-acetylmuramoyl-L-alanine amidase